MSKGLNYLPAASGNPVSVDDLTLNGDLQNLQRVKIGLGPSGQYQSDLSLREAPVNSGIPVVTPLFNTFFASGFTVGFSCVQLPVVTNLKESFVLQASYANLGIIVLGNSGVTRYTGLELSAGDPITLNINNLNLVWASGTASGQCLLISSI